MNGRGFAYRAWRLYYAPDSLFLGTFGVDPDAREKFFQDYWEKHHG